MNFADIQFPTFTPAFIAFVTFCAPGLCALIPYLTIWRIERRGCDYFIMIIGFVFFFRGIQDWLSLLSRFVFGSSYMFGAWGETTADCVMCAIGLVLGVRTGLLCRAMPDAGADHYPWDPLVFR